jgi:hypothetical protein
MVTTATPPLVLSDGNLALAYEPPLSVEPIAYTSEQPKARLRFWMVRHIGAMSVDNTNVIGMDYANLPPHVAIVQWQAGVGEIEYDDRPRLRENFVDVTPYCPFLQQFMNRLVGITVTQAKKIQCDLIDVLYESKRQMPYHYVIAAGDYTWDATDDVVAAMSIATIPSIISILVGTSDSTVVGKINTLADQINANIVVPGNQNKNNGNTMIGEINSNIVTPGNNGFVTTDSVFGQVNNQIVGPAGTLAFHLDETVLGAFTGVYNTNCINDKLRTDGTVAAPGLAADIPKSNVSFTLVDANPYRLATIITTFLGTFVNVSHASTTPDPSIPPITWTPSGAAAPVNLTATEMQGLMSGIATRRASLLNVRITKKNAVNTLTTLPEVIAYDVTTGWPS